MMYQAKTQQFTISKKELDNACGNFVYALKNIRDMAGLPHTKYKREGMLTPADHAQKGIIDAAKHLGIDLGGEWGEDVDLTDYN